MKHLPFLILILISTTFAEQTLLQETVDGKQVNIIRVVLDGQHKIVTSASQDGESLASLIEKAAGVSGINGAYFCPADYPACDGKNTTNADRIVEGDGKSFSQYWPDTGSRGIFGFDKQGNFLFVRNNEGWSGGVKGEFHSEDLNKLWYGIGNHPVLLQDGVDMVPEYEKAGLVDAKMKTAGIKNMICITEDESTVYMGNVANITISEMPEYLERNFGCRYALNLDSGGSLGMQYEGTNIRTPGRNIMDAFVVVETPESQNNSRETAYHLASLGIIQKQSSAADYQLDRKVFRQEIIAMALKTIGAVNPEKAILFPERYDCKNIFSDVGRTSPNAWACRSIEYAAEYGFITQENKTFRPEDTVSRAEALAIMLKAADMQPTTPKGQKWENVILEYAFKHGIVSSAKLSPITPLTRREVFAITEKIIESALK